MESLKAETVLRAAAIGDPQQKLTTRDSERASDEIFSDWEMIHNVSYSVGPATGLLGSITVLVRSYS